MYIYNYIHIRRTTRNVKKPPANNYDKEEGGVWGREGLSPGHVQSFFFSRNIRSVTPKIIYFYYLITYFPDQNIQKNKLFDFENRSTGHVTQCVTVWRCSAPCHLGIASSVAFQLVREVRRQLVVLLLAGVNERQHEIVLSDVRFHRSFEPVRCGNMCRG